MRRSAAVYLGTAAAVLLLAVFFHGLSGRRDVVRYHQHLEQPGEAELGECPVCGGEGELCTHLPVVNIDTGGQKIPGGPLEAPDGTVLGYDTGTNGETEVLVEFSTVSEEGVWHHPDDKPTEKGQAMFRIRGNSSRWFSKSSYRLRLVERSNPEQEVRLPILGMEKATEWALYGPFLDKTLIRNYMWMNLSAEVMGYAPDVRFCEVMMDGEYRGVYVMMEMNLVQEGRVELTKYREGDPVCSYLVRIEPSGASEKMIDNFTFYTERMEEKTHLELVYPGLRNQSPEVKNYVQADFSEIEKRLYSLDMTGGSGEWRDSIDMDSFADYYILQEFLAINDTFSASTYFYRDVRGKLTAGPVWDFNNALDNFFRSMPHDEFVLSQRGWFSQLMKDEAFVERVISRYRQLRKGVLSEENLLRYADETEAWLGNAIQRNFNVWGYSFDPGQLSRRERRTPEGGSGLALEDVNPSSHEEAVEWMKDYMVDRGRFLDEHIESLRQYCHPSKNAIDVQG